MKYSNAALMIGIFFVFMQFSTVILFNQMFAISNKHALPTDQLAKYQITIMNIIIISLVMVSILFLILMIGVVRNVWKTEKVKPIND